MEFKPITLENQVTIEIEELEMKLAPESAATFIE
jgi:hypothetical protein